VNFEWGWRADRWARRRLGRRRVRQQFKQIDLVSIAADSATLASTTVSFDLASRIAAAARFRIVPGQRIAMLLPRLAAFAVTVATTCLSIGVQI
jgi:hypothetical protein